YSVAPPRESFEANLNKSTGVLTISGSVRDDDGSSDRIDDIRVTRAFFGAPEVVVLFQDDDQPTLELDFPEGLVKEIRVDTGIGADSINIDAVGPGRPVTVDAGAEADFISVAGFNRNLAFVESNVFIT